MEKFTSTEVDIDPNGDLTLLLSSDQGEVSVRVSSKSLSLASPVFKAMLCSDSPFLEGSELKRTGETQVELDDDYGALMAILRALHFQSKLVPRRISFNELCDIAIVSDKYNLAESVLPWYQIWAAPYKSSIFRRGYERWLFIAWVYTDEVMFRQVPHHWILSSRFNDDGSFMVSYNASPTEGLPDSIIDKIKQQRNKLINDLLSEIENQVGEYYKCGREGTYMCKGTFGKEECDIIGLGTLLRDLAALELWPNTCDFQSNAIESLMCELEDAGSFGNKSTYGQWGATGIQGDHIECSSNTRLTEAIFIIQSGVVGLSLAQFHPNAKATS